MQFVLFDPEGRIYQASVVRDWKKGPHNKRKVDHDQFLRDMGEQFAMIDKSTPLDPDDWYWNGTAIKPRVPMRVAINAMRLPCNDDYPALLRGIVGKVVCTVMLRRYGTVGSEEITIRREPATPIYFPTPGLYTIRLEKFPYKTWTADVEVTEP